MDASAAAAALMSVLSSLDPELIRALVSMNREDMAHQLSTIGAQRASSSRGPVGVVSAVAAEAEQDVQRRFHFEPNVEEGEVPQVLRSLIEIHDF